MNFLFGCCKSVQSNNGYLTRKKGSKTGPEFINSLNDLSAKDLQSHEYQIVQMERSDYERLMKEYSGTEKKWTDFQFQPDKESLGDIQGVSTNKWKRISDLLNKPALFDGKIEPKDVVQGSLDDCYFLSALAALAEREENIRAVFKDQTYNPNGIYKVTLRVDGEIKQVLVDDFVPVNNDGQPLFSQPNKNQFWVLLLEKAWAKVNGSYANIVSGNPCEIFKAVSCAPVQTYLIKENDEENEKIWRIILNQVKRKYPSTCSTRESQSIEWESLGLIQNHSYTLTDAAEFKNAKQNKIHRVLQLRDPWGRVQWQGQASENDQRFWQRVQNSLQKQQFLKKVKKSKDGIFFITYEDFCRYFSQLHFCMIEENANYLVENLYVNKKNGSVYTFEVAKPGTYFFELHQSTPYHSKFDNHEEENCRSTMLLARVLDKGKDYQFVDGILKYNDKDTTLKATLSQGSYILYTKLDPTPTNKTPQQTSVSIYSPNLLLLTPSTQQAHPQLLKKLFLNHAKLNKRQTYNNDLMWIAWKLLYLQGGYAYIAFGNDLKSVKKFVVTFDEEEFGNLHFRLKKEFKGKGNGQVLEVLPGEEKIILARVKNQKFKGLKFPPQINIKLEPIKTEPNALHS